MLTPRKKRRLAMAGRAIAAFDWYDRVLQDEPKPDPPVQCKRGCAACCYQFVGLVLPEAHAILLRHRNLVEGLLPRLRADSAILGEMLERMGLDPNMDGHELIGDLRERVADAWWELKRPCPFLDLETKDCRIYESRPGACRSYHVISDPALCSSEEPIEVTGWRPKLMELTERIVKAQGNDEVTVGPLAEVLLFARRELR